MLPVWLTTWRPRIVQDLSFGGKRVGKVERGKAGQDSRSELMAVSTRRRQRRRRPGMCQIANCQWAPRRSVTALFGSGQCPGSVWLFCEEKPTVLQYSISLGRVQSGQSYSYYQSMHRVKAAFEQTRHFSIAPLETIVSNYGRLEH
jgi:hypothetical protein